MKGRHEEALAVLKRMHGGITDDDEFYLREFHQIKAQIELDEQERLGFRRHTSEEVLSPPFDPDLDFLAILPTDRHHSAAKLPGCDISKARLFPGL